MQLTLMMTGKLRNPIHIYVYPFFLKENIYSYTYIYFLFLNI